AGCVCRIVAAVAGTDALPSGTPWYAPGRKAEDQLLTPPWPSVGQIVTKPGRSGFSLPRPYRIQLPRLGRTKVSEPVWTFSRAPPCASLLPCIDLTKHRSSTQRATCGNSSLTQAPHSPCWRKRQGEPSRLPVSAKVTRGLGKGSGLPESRCSSGL